MNLNQVEQRRCRISNFIVDNPTVGFENVKYISTELGIEYDTVVNDLVFLKKKQKEEMKKYNLSGLFSKHLKKVKRLEEIKIEVKAIGDAAGTVQEKLHAKQLEADLIQSIYGLESDGLTPIEEELEARDLQTAKEKESKKDGDLEE